MTSPLISEDRRGAFLFEKRGNLKQTVPQRRKKSVVLKGWEGNDNLSVSAFRGKKEKQICKSCKEKFWQTPQE